MVGLHSKFAATQSGSIYYIALHIVSNWNWERGKDISSLFTAKNLILHDIKDPPSLRGFVNKQVLL